MALLRGGANNLTALRMDVVFCWLLVCVYSAEIDCKDTNFLRYGKIFFTKAKKAVTPLPFSE